MRFMPSAPITPSSLTLLPAKRKRLTELFREFSHDYLPTAPAQAYLAALTDSRARARSNYLALVAQAERSEEITEAVLRTLLPHADSTTNRWRGAWIHPAAAIPGDLRTWHEAAGWSQGDEWPQVAAAILHFVRTVLEEPAQLATACADFHALPYTAGFQSGMLTPILNALAPETFLLLTNRNRTALNYFAETHFTQSLPDYAAANEALFVLLRELARGRKGAEREALRLADHFTLFAHWLATVKQFSFRLGRYWALALDADPWLWREWQEGNMIGIGWDAFGDLSDIRKSEFAARRDSLIAQHQTGSKRGAEAVWRFARQLHEGDEIVVYQAGQVLGVGVVTGPYYYIPDVPLGHRRPVEWRDLQQRAHGQRLGASALTPIDLATFTALTTAPLAQEAAAPPVTPEEKAAAPEFAELFVPLLETLQSLGGQARANELLEAISDRLGDRAQAQEPSPTRLNRLRRQLYRARHYLVRAGLLKTKQHGLWQLTPQGQATALHDGDAARLFEEIEYQQQWQQSLATESSTLRQLAESTVPYTTTPTDPQDEPRAATLPPPREETAPMATPDVPMVDTVGTLDEPYSLADCAAATLLEEATLARWVQSIERKGQAIFYGPPGVGKTFLAEQLARHLASPSGDTTAGFVEVVQFHPAYAYEDFVQGIRPQPGPAGTLHYPVVPGRFLSFCQRAATVTGRAVLIIDEINRADLARVFGELMYLLEYRERSVRLAADGRNFAIPPNVRLLGTMNTADRSIALVDHALRRRFAFIALQPDYALLRRYHQAHDTDVAIDGLIGLMQRVNRQISDAHYAIGHSFFLRADLATTLPDIWQLEIEPYLEEIFFDQAETVAALRWSRVRHELNG